jgi:GT2 family glycosyltransferase
MNQLAIVIVSHNARADLDRCLGSLEEAPPATSHETVVVDNASSDGSAEAAAHRQRARLIGLNENRGFAAATNVGIRATSSELVLLLNSDTIVPPGAVDRLVAVLARHPDAAIAGPRLVDGDGRVELSFGRMITPLNERRQRRMIQAHLAHGRGASCAVEDMTRREGWPDWVSGACLLVRREDAEAVGLLDERFFLYTEDVDFCAAIRQRGRRVLFTPEVEIVHARGRSAAVNPAATRAAYRRSHLAFYEKHHPRLAPVLRLYRLFLQ